MAESKIIDDIYSIDSDGNIYNHKRNIILKPRKSGYGYLSVTMYNNKTRYVHKLIAEFFIPNPENKSQVNHKDGNKLNNSIDNLEWCTVRENLLHAMHNGLNNGRKKEIIQYDKFMNQINTFESALDAQRQTGIDNSHINKVCQGKRKTAGKYIWKFGGTI